MGIAAGAIANRVALKTMITVRNGAAGLHPAVSRPENREQAEGRESKRHRREQEFPEWLRQDRLQRQPAELPLPWRIRVDRDALLVRV